MSATRTCQRLWEQHRQQPNLEYGHQITVHDAAIDLFVSLESLDCSKYSVWRGLASPVICQAIVEAISFCVVSKVTIGTNQHIFALKKICLQVAGVWFTARTRLSINHEFGGQLQTAYLHSKTPLVERASKVWVTSTLLRRGVSFNNVARSINAVNDG